MEKLIHGHAAQILDALGARLAFERTGVKLYDTVITKIQRSGEPRYHRILKKLHEIRDDEKEHEEWLEAQIRAVGGRPDEITTLSQLEAEESTGIQNVILDGHEKTLHLLHALLAAEAADNAGWDLLVKLADQTGDKKAKRAFMKRMASEMEHLAYIRAAVQRGAEIELLGRDVELPSGTGGALARPLAIAALVVAAGAVTAAVLFRRAT
jgi:rubrerythrin